MGFLDLDDIEKDSRDAVIVPHPLKDALSDSVRTAYLSAIVFGAFADDGELTEAELSYGRMRALSLGLKESDFDDAVASVKALASAKERKEFLFEMLVSFSSRDVALYLLCDMAMAMASDGDLTNDATRFLDSLCRMLGKCEAHPDNPLTDDDIAFLAAYRPYLAPGKTADASETVDRLRISGYDFPAGLLKFFSPDLRPVLLKGGGTAPGEFRLVGGRYRLEEPLTISSGTKFVMQDAELEFGANGMLTINVSDVTIADCRFTVSKDVSGNRVGAPMFATSTDRLTFVNCQFAGENLRSFKTDENVSLTCTGCTFSSLFSSGDVICSYRLTFKDCKFEDCRSSGSFLIRSPHIYFTNCEFRSCRSIRAMFGYYGSSSGDYQMLYCKFVDCGSSDICDYYDTGYGSNGGERSANCAKNCTFSHSSWGGFVSESEYESARAAYLKGEA